MIRFLVDSDVLIDALRGRDYAVDLLRDRGERSMAVSIISVGELYEGAHSISDPSEQIGVIQHFLRNFPVVGLGDDAMLEFAFLRSMLRKRGDLIRDLDLLIAATAIRSGRILITRNLRHFRRIPKLQLFDFN